jgi:hypothetical protein
MGRVTSSNHGGKFVKLRRSSWISPSARQRVARFFLLTGAVGPGLALLLAPARWGASPIFVQLSQLPVPLQFFGLSLLLASILILIPKWRDIGYVWVAMFYLVTNISGIFAILYGHGTSALIFALPVLLWLYLEAAITATRDEVQLPTAYTETPGKGQL